MHRLIALALAAVLAGCATTDHAPAQVTRLKDGQAVTITGFIGSNSEAGTLSTLTHRRLNVLVNGEKAISAPIDSATYTGDFAGTWKDKAVAALCSSSRRNSQVIDVRCVILIDNERTVTLSF